ncbi:caveolin domain-containing protein [Ditylenchus destructor]|nr:caveolin domain-containing protein [Ditylenchus destructor]
MSEQDKGVELSEQTPLKSDTDTPVVGAETTVVGVVPQEPVATESKKRGWIFSKKSKTTKAEETSAVAPKDVEGGTAGTTNTTETKKKCHWWQRKPCPELTHQQQLSYGINLVQRDDRSLQTGIDLAYEDIYGEPDSVHSMDGIWRTNYAVFQTVRSFFYKFFSFIIAIPLAIVFGVLFALVSALSVFLCIPAGRLFSIPVGWIFKAWSYLVSSIFEPVFRSISHVFGNVKISSYGINTDPTAILSA